MPAEQKHLFVAGGSGFVGRHVCRFAVSLGHRVTSLSRRGRPDTGEPWEEGVEWMEGDALEPDAWRDALEEVDAAIGAVGLIREEPDAGRTFERINRDAILSIAREAATAEVPTFVYLSSAAGLPGLAPGYLASKREAESALDDCELERIAVLRAPPGYGAERPSSIAAVPLLKILDGTSGDDDGHEPIPVEQIAIATLRAALEPDIEGLLEAEEVADLGEAVMIQ